MRAGLLRTRIVIQSATEAADGVTGATETWTAFRHASAQKIASPGKETFDQASVSADQVVMWKLRWISGVTEDMRVLDGGSGYADGLTDAALVVLGYAIHKINSVVNLSDRSRELRLVTTQERK